MRLISTITSKGHIRFMIKEKDGVNASVFIECLKRLMMGAKRRILLIVDRDPAYCTKKTQEFVKTLNGKLKLFYLPPYAPDRSPDELVWKHSKTDTAGRMITTDKVSFKGHVISSMRSLQNNPDKIRSFFQNHSLKYVA